MEWTKEQKQVIGQRNSNILVSAAAGSGKTTVLVERILSRVLDRDHPVNVDEFLIVTFTKAAASHMKEGLQKALERALEKDRDNEHLQRQVMLVPMAQISTIHSFCGYVIQNYFHRTGVDPSYRVGTENEMSLVKADVMKEMLEEKYAGDDEAFLQMAAMSRFVKSDAEIEDIVLSLYEKAVSDPFPAQFLGRMKEFVSMESVEELKHSHFIRENVTYAKHLLSGICEECRGMLTLCDSPGGPVLYREVILDDQAQMERLCAEEDYGELGRKLGLVEWKRLPGKKTPDADEQKKEAVKRMRDAVKKAVKSLRDHLFDRPLEEQMEQLKQMRGIITAFIGLTEEFMERYRAKKSERALVDFNDLEQMAMEILVERDEEGTIHRTEAAVQLAEQFEEIMIDEYQDSNLVQEMLLGSVASDRNRFMVGDIKQSIYRFRMACPDLFLEKLHAYSTDEGAENRLISLSRNFRSRDVVIDGTNAVFRKIMHRELGGVEYDSDAELRLGADFPQTEHRTADGVDIYALDRGDKAENGVPGMDDGSYEGKVIAGLIQDYVGTEDPLFVYEDGEYRKARYGDIVILARSTRAVGQQIYDVLVSEGIPVYMENTKGFFDTREISTMVNLFYIIDNPRQDIPLAAVMRSPVFDFTDDELALIRGREKHRDFYESLLEAAASEGRESAGEEEKEGGSAGQAAVSRELAGKVAAFLKTLNRFRDRMTHATVADMIQDIYDDTHTDHIFTAMKNGMQRKANLDMLMELAREFDRTSYRGLYQFVRYISGIKQREEDLGEANLLGNKEDVVRIMTIHKSKGLEFPVCILAGMGRNITGAGKSSFLMVNPAVGVASRVIDNERGLSVNNTFYRSLSRMNTLEDLGEELRVLYVAMTRAKEKLVLVGFAEEEKIPFSTNFFQMIRAKSYFDWVLPAVRGVDGFTVQWVKTEQLMQREISRQADSVIDEVMLYNFDTTGIYDEKIEEKLAFMEEYRETDREEIPVKLTVSEIKKRSMEEYREEGGLYVPDADEEEDGAPVPAFAKEESGEDDGGSGTGYGTVWHQVMSGLDFARISSEKEVETELRHMVQAGKIREDDIRYIRADRIMKFLRSPLGQEVKAAKAAGKLFREQPFVTGVRASEVLPGTERDDIVLVQGIIDAFYETEEGIVLLDYKTDRLEAGEEELLVRRYRKQMELYAAALEGIMKKKVVRRELYSLSLNRPVTV